MILVALAVGLGPGLGQARVGFVNAGEELVTVFHVVADSATSGGALSTTPPSAALEYQAIQSGQTQATLALPGGIPYGIYLNLSHVSPFWFLIQYKLQGAAGATSLQGAAGSTGYTGKATIAAYLGGHRLYINELAPAALTNPGYASMTAVGMGPQRPEWAEGAKGATLQLVFTVPAGATLTIGIGGTEGTKMSFRHFVEDPYAYDPMFIERVAGPNQGKIFRGTSVGEEGSQAVWFLAAGLLPLLAPRRPTRRVGIAGLALILAFSGCSGKSPVTSSDEPATEPAPNVIREARETNETLQRSNRGGLMGVITDGDRFDIPLPGVTIELENASVRTHTDDRGEYRLESLIPFHYVALVTPPVPFLPARRELDILPGIVTWLNISFHRPDTFDGSLAHRHGEAWGGARSLVLLDRTVTVAAERSASSLSTSLPRNEVEIGLPDDVKVEPGTARLNVTASYTQEPIRPFLVSLTANIPRPENRATIDDFEFTVRALGEPTIVPVLPSETDPGHQDYSDWTFKFGLWIAKGSPWTGTPTEIHLRIVAERSDVIPYESPHPDPWGEATRIVIVNRASDFGLSPGDAQGLADRARAPGEYYIEACWASGKVPSGAARIEGAFWFHTRHDGASYDAVPDAVAQTFGYNQPIFLYRPRPAAEWTVASDPVLKRENATGFSVKIPVGATETDGFYSRPGWEFCVASKRPQDDLQPSQFYRYYTFHLVLEVVKGPTPGPS